MFFANISDALEEVITEKRAPGPSTTERS